MKSMKLGYGAERRDGKGLDYQVTLVKNSTVYKPGQILCEAEVEDLCKNPHWDITVVRISGAV